LFIFVHSYFKDNINCLIFILVSWLVSWWMLVEEQCEDADNQV